MLGEVPVVVTRLCLKKGSAHGVHAHFTETFLRSACVASLPSTFYIGYT